jgi:ribosomal protein L7Ae-like RNA K-turn-binding protein
MDEQRFLFALGLAQKAGKLASGDFAVHAALKSGEAKLLVLAADTAANTKKELQFLADARQVPVLEATNKTYLGKCIGKAQRTAVVVLDPGFVKMLKKAMLVDE